MIVFFKKVVKNLVVRDFCRIFVVLIYYVLWLSIIFNPKEKTARYQTLLSEETKDRLRDEIIRLIVTERKYKDPEYNSKKLAEDLNTNSRYISAVCATRFHKNYSELVNDYRVNDAMSLLTDKRYAKMSVEDISEMAGFSTRQSFYANFYKRIGITPRQYRLDHLQTK